MNKRKDIIQKLFYEAESYKNINDLEQLFESEVDLSSIPIQPLYLLMKAAPLDTRAQVLEKLNPEQRQAIYDLEGWNRDDLDLKAFDELPLTVVKSNNLKVIAEFANSDLFLLFLKGAFTIRTFDPEEANYPDHDSFFITDDNAFIVEYNEDTEAIKEVQYLIKNLYGKLGVNKAFHLLMDLINQSYTIMLEDQYQKKKERLRDYGFVDPYEAAELVSNFRNFKQIDEFITNKKLTVGRLTSLSRSQALHSKALKGLVDDMDEFQKQLEKINDEKKLDFLQFDFIRLINSTLAVNDALKKGSLTFTRINKETKVFLKLGLEYTKSKVSESEQSLFDNFTFIDLYRIGKSLIKIEQLKIRKIKKEIDEGLEGFLGQHLNDIGDVLTDDSVRLGKSLAEFNQWQEKSIFFQDILSYVKQFYATFVALKESGKLSDHFYINYNVDEIDFEALILSSFLNFSLGQYQQTEHNKIGLSFTELKKWAHDYLDKKNENYALNKNSKIGDEILKFKKQFGFEKLAFFENYLLELTDFHLSGYDYDALKFEDYKHIGGPIILNMN